MAMNPKVLNVGLRGLTLVVRFALIFMLAFYLPPAEVGLYGLVVATVSYSLYFVGFDFYTFSTRDLLGRSRSEWAPLLFSQGMLFLALYLVVLPLALFLFVFGFLPWWLAGWVLALIISEHLAQEVSRLAIAMGRPLFASVMVFVRQGLWPIMFIALMWRWPEYRSLEALVMFWCVGSALSVVFGGLLFRAVDWHQATLRLDLAWIRRGIAIAFPLLMATLALRGIMTIDRYAFEALNGPELLGAYSLFMGMAGAVLAFMDAGVFSFLYPRMINHYSKKDWHGFHAARSALRRHTLIWTGLLFLGGSIVGPWLFKLLPDEIYFNNWPLFVGLLAGMGIFVVGMIPHYGLYSMSQDKPIIKAHFFGLLVFLLSVVAIGNISPVWAVVIAFGLASLAMGIFKQVSFVLVSRQPGMIGKG